MRVESVNTGLGLTFCSADETRVKLSLVDGKPNSDYINANWIETVCIDLFYEVLLVMVTHCGLF